MYPRRVIFFISNIETTCLVIAIELHSCYLLPLHTAKNEHVPFAAFSSFSMGSMENFLMLFSFLLFRIFCDALLHENSPWRYKIVWNYFTGLDGWIGKAFLNTLCYSSNGSYAFSFLVQSWVWNFFGSCGYFVGDNSIKIRKINITLRRSCQEVFQSLSNLTWARETLMHYLVHFTVYKKFNHFRSNIKK